MIINVNNYTPAPKDLLATMSKFIKDTDNGHKTDMQSYDYNSLSDYDIVLIEYSSNVAKGIIRTEMSDSPKNAFISSINREKLNMEDVVQLKITHIDIPRTWTDKSVLNEIFECFQWDMDTYFYKKKVVLWFEYGQYYMCPVPTDVNNNEFKQFAPYMANLFSNILRKL